ncbi:hypothetical protein [Fortiea contorta]|uniref:hypothetical protein n=1 Tax=Fortiea contorta TaxID=1892405 RepID=UPI0003455EA8|nr:hypothetical protein [Fortiea contorta]
MGGWGDGGIKFTPLNLKLEHQNSPPPHLPTLPQCQILSTAVRSLHFKRYHHHISGLFQISRNLNSSPKLNFNC